MPLTRIKNTAIGDDGVTTRKLDDTSGGFTMPGQQFMKVPVGTTAQRPTSPENGHLRYNTNFERLEQYADGVWQSIDTPPSITSLAYAGSLTGADPAGGETVTLTGSNFQTGALVTVGGTAATSVTVIGSTSITFTTPAKTAGDYDVVVTNANGLSARLTGGISVNGTPSFTTAAGNIGTLNPDVAMSTITIVATEPDGGTLSYSVTTGAVPTGTSMSSAGAITGTPTGPAADTTSTFTVTATDDEGQTNTRQFNLIVLRPVYSLALSNSVRLDSTHNTHLVRDNRLIGSGMAAGGNTFTVACWVKKERDSTKDVTFIGAETGTNARFIVYVNGNNLRFFGRNSSNVTQFDVVANNVIPDSTGWYHVMMVFDTTNSTANDTTRFYVNGVRVAQSNITTNNSASGNGANGTGLQLFYIGRDAGGYSDGYIADYHFIWDVAKTDPFEFIQSYRGVLIPKAYTGSYGTYGFHLDFADSALTSAGLGNDNAGIGDFTVVNFPDANAEAATGSVLTDTPTSNHSTLLDMSYNNATINKGMLRSTVSAARYFAAGNTGVNSGEWYWEMHSTHFASGQGGVAFGMIPVAEMTRASANSGDLHSHGMLGGRIRAGAQPYVYINGGTQNLFGTTSTFSSTDTVGFSMDFDNHEFKIYTTSDGNAVYTLDTSSVTNTYSGYGGGNWPWYLPAGGNETGSQTKTIHWNFGQDNFAISGGIPSGFKAISEANKGEPAVSPLTDANHAGGNFEAKTYTGDGNATQAITGLGFQPDLIVSKKYDAGYNWSVYDSVRGPNKRLNTNTTATQTTEGLDSFDSDGFTLNNTGSLNASGSYVAYCWKAGGAPTAANVATSGAMTANSVSLNGTLQSAYTPSGSPSVYPVKMSINTEAGFSIIEYNTGSNGDTFTIPHGLGKKPQMIWHKGGYNSTAFNWDCYFNWTPSGGNQNGHLGRVKLNSPDGFTNETGDVPWADTAPISDIINMSNSSSSSGDWWGYSKEQIMYVWTAIPGYSDFGFYRGNNESADIYQPFIYTGFRPRIVIIKDVSSGSTDWTVFDTAREDGYNMYQRNMFSQNTAATSIASNTSARVNFMANGFRIVGGNGSFVNTLNDAYVYAAFAEMPGKYSAGIENLNT